MSDRQALIKRMLELQKMFIDYEVEHGVTQKDYYVAPKQHPLHGFKEEFRELALKLAELAHKDLGSRA